MAGLGDMVVGAVLRAEDFGRAKKFYTEVLGLKAEESGGPTPEGMFTAGGGTMVSIYERPGMPAPQNTTLQFGVPKDRFEAAVADLPAALQGQAWEVGLKQRDAHRSPPLR